MDALAPVNVTSGMSSYISMTSNIVGMVSWTLSLAKNSAVAAVDSVTGLTEVGAGLNKVASTLGSIGLAHFGGAVSAGMGRAAGVGAVSASMGRAAGVGAVSAGMGRAASIGALSVPPTWSTFAPASAAPVSSVSATRKFAALPAPLSLVWQVGRETWQMGRPCELSPHTKLKGQLCD